jgi:hypothetical protein
VGESNITTQLEVFPKPANDKVTIRINGKGIYTVNFNGASQKWVLTYGIPFYRIITSKPVRLEVSVYGLLLVPVFL